MEVNPKQREFFNERAEMWDEISLHDMGIVKYIASLLELKGGERILDVGTGTGVMIPFYESYLTDGSIIALDYSEKMIEVAKRKYPIETNPAVTYRVGDLYDIADRDCYDTVVCYSCFPHFPDKERAIETLSRVLRRGGTLMVSHGCSRDKINQVHRDGGEIIEHDYLPTMQKMEKMFSDMGIRVVQTRDDENCFIIMGVKV